MSSGENDDMHMALRIFSLCVDPLLASSLNSPCRRMDVNYNILITYALESVAPKLSLTYQALALEHAFRLGLGVG